MECEVEPPSIESAPEKAVPNKLGVTWIWVILLTQIIGKWKAGQGCPGEEPRIGIPIDVVPEDAVGQQYRVNWQINGNAVYQWYIAATDPLTA